MILPAVTFFRPNVNFLQLMSELKSPIIEVGCGSGFNLSEMKKFGKAEGFGHMENARGFDLWQRTEYFDRGIITGYDINDNFPFNHENFTVLVCRPDHGGWFSEALEAYLEGDRPSKRVIYVGKPHNVHIDLTEAQIACVTNIYEDVGEAGEIMMVWEN